MSAEAHGLEIDLMEWSPIGKMVEKSGREGGCGHALGYNADEVIEWIERGQVKVER
jgi:hypothetical protein